MHELWKVVEHNLFVHDPVLSKLVKKLIKERLDNDE